MHNSVYSTSPAIHGMPNLPPEIWFRFSDVFRVVVVFGAHPLGNVGCVVPDNRHEPHGISGNAVASWFILQY